MVRPVSAVRRTRRHVIDDMQKLRQKLLVDLTDAFSMAKAYAQSKSKTADGKDAVTPKQQRIWIRITAYTRQVMNK